MVRHSLGVVHMQKTMQATFNNFNFYNYDALKYRPKAITNAVLINKGDLYSDLDKTRTYSYLSQLNAFKYPNIEYVE